MIPQVDSILEIVPKDLEKGLSKKQIGERIDINQTTAVLKLAGIPSRVLEN